MATDTRPVSRRQALRRGAAAGAVVWAVPMVTSSVAHASGGSNGSKIEGRLDSVTCVWDRRYYQPNRGTPTAPKHDYSNDTFCEINVGQGWQLLSRDGQFTIAAGNVVQMRPWSGHAGGSTAEPTGDLDTSDDSVSLDDESTQTEPVETEPVETTATVPATTATLPPETTTPAVPADAPTTTLGTVPTDPALSGEATLPPVSASADAVDTIVIDMSGRTDINIGDVYGYFRVVDAVPA